LTEFRTSYSWKLFCAGDIGYLPSHPQLAFEEVGLVVQLYAVNVNIRRRQDIVIITVQKILSRRIIVIIRLQLVAPDPVQPVVRIRGEVVTAAVSIMIVEVNGIIVIEFTRTVIRLQQPVRDVRGDIDDGVVLLDRMLSVEKGGIDEYAQGIPFVEEIVQAGPDRMADALNAPGLSCWRKRVSSCVRYWLA
jgi:hypothetical protein